MHVFSFSRTVAEAPYEEERQAWDSIPDTAIGSL
jgi:hypothetical protein